MEARSLTAVDLVAFAVEVTALGLLAAWGWAEGGEGTGGWLLAVAVPALAAVLWGALAAPRAPIRSPVLEVGTKVLVLGASVLAALWLWPVWASLAYGAVVVVDTTLLYVGPWSRGGRRAPSPAG